MSTSQNLPSRHVPEKVESAFQQRIRVIRCLCVSSVCRRWIPAFTGMISKSVVIRRSRLARACADCPAYAAVAFAMPVRRLSASARLG